MPKNHVQFHSANGKRLVLIVDDELVNREILSNILAGDYETITATNGREALDIIRSNSELINLVLLDLIMPEMHGLELLKILREEPGLNKIPVIVMTADRSAEVDSLNFGASDFIPKPFPEPRIILARVTRTIELFEDRQIIQSTERDSLTGLYNREYFYNYAVTYDQHHKDVPMDAVVMDVNHFHMINERYGKTYGDEVLKRIGGRIRDIICDSGGIAARREADTFLIYCPHRSDYEKILDGVSIGLAGEENAGNRVRLRIGVYSNADKSLDMERRFDRAKMAADTVRNSFSKTIAFYDENLHQAEIYDEQLLEDFQEAINQKQFVVYYQPKFDIRPEIPVLHSAEALVRWNHPVLGMISPGIFIPLFEQNGLIKELDNYVWEEAARQIRDWKNRFGITVPVSVNVSRIDMYDPELIQTFADLMKKYDISSREYLLEITESAYTQDAEQIISTVNRMREMGFRIEMDDFGTGYSSLNMISTLPIDALKLDMQFIHNAFKGGKDTRMIEVIIDIADYLNVPVIAEGVETEEQLNALKVMGCDIVQGYYFSRPVPPEEYECFVIEHQNSIDAVPVRSHYNIEKENLTIGRIAHALSSGFESIYYVDTDQGNYVEFSSQGKYEDLQIQRSGTDFFGDTQRNLKRVVYREDQERLALSMQREALMAQLMSGQHFSITYRLMIDDIPTYYNLKAVRVNTHDDHHIVIGISNVNTQITEAMMNEESQSSGLEFINIAHALSSDYESVYYVSLDTGAYLELTAPGAYEKLQIETRGEDFFAETASNLKQVVYIEDQEKVCQAMQRDNLLSALEEKKYFVMSYRLMIHGVPEYYRIKVVRTDDNGEHHLVIGISNVDSEIRKQLEYEKTINAARSLANRDALTGVKSRHAYLESEKLIDQQILLGGVQELALVVCDVNGLKNINDTLGHQAGDLYIQDACRIICQVFKHSPVYRIGGDEFVAVLQGQDYENRGELMMELTERVEENRRKGKVVIARGISDLKPHEDHTLAELFERADAAMYENKKQLKAGG